MNISASKTNRCKIGYATMTVLAASCSTMTFAQTTQVAPDDEAGLQEITVTAQKRPENLQQTPISISVLGSDDLTNRHVQSLLDLGDGAVPSLRVAPFFSRPGALIINVRGVGVLSDSNQPARDQGVGVYIDGVYLGRAQGLGSALYDVASIEVLKGPQGTLFGRNTEGGAVSIVTKRPSGEFKMNTTIGGGNHGSYKAETHIDLPEAANISIKLDGILSHRDGFVKNLLASASDFNAYDKRGFHFEALWKPSSTFSADYSFDTSYDASSTLYLQAISPGLGLANPVIAANKLPVINIIQPTRASTAVFGSPQQPSVGKTNGLRLVLDWQAMPTLTLKSITAYRNLTQGQFDNGSASPAAQNASGNFTNFAFSRYSLANFRQNQVSQELQAIGKFEHVKFVAGAFYYQERVEDNAQAFNTNLFTNATGSTYSILTIDPATQVIQRASHVVTTSVGVFGQATYTPPLLDDIFHLTVGGRWTRDKKVGELFTINGALPVVPIAGQNVSKILTLDAAWSRIDPMVNLAIDVSRDVHAYGKWSTGYRSGGANSRSLNYQSFNPETVSMFEIGAKTEFWDRRARFNVAAYAGAYKAIQLDFFGAYIDNSVNPPVNTTRTTSDTINAPGTGRLKGVEAELTLAPVEGLTLMASYAYNSVKIPATLNPFPVPGSGGKFITVPVPIYQVYTPENSASASIDYEVPLNGFTLRAHLDGNYDSGYYANATDVAYDPITRAVTFEQPKGDKALVFNGRLACADIDLGASDAKLTVAIWARNLFNEQHLFYKSSSASAGISGFFNDPRTIGVETNIKF